MRVLVTGAGGFVGSNVARRLATDGYHVAAIVHRTRPKQVEGVRGLELATADLAVPGALAAAVSGRFDAVIHCASAIPATIADEAELYRINVAGYRSVLDHAAQSGARTFVNCSSMAAFGTIDSSLVDPSTPVNAPGAYGRSKLEGERMVAKASAEAGRASVSLRLPGIVGRGSHDNFLSTVMAAIIAGKPVKARNPDAFFNNIVHIDDLVGFLAALTGSLGSGHRVATIATDTPITLREVLALMYATARRSEQIIWDNGGQPFLISPEPARSLGFRAPDTADSVRRFVRDCMNGA